MKDIFDAFLIADTKRQNALEADRLRRDNIHISNSCGSCYKWMTSDCPRESKVHKVHCNELRCDQFQITKHSIDLIEKQKVTITKLTL